MTLVIKKEPKQTFSVALQHETVHIVADTITEPEASRQGMHI